MMDWQKALSERAKTISRDDDARLMLRAADRIRELEMVIKSHGIPVKTFAGGEAHYALGSELDADKPSQQYVEK